MILNVHSLSGIYRAGVISHVKLPNDYTGEVFNGRINCEGTELSLENCAIQQETNTCEDQSVLYVECLGNVGKYSHVFEKPESCFRLIV